MSKLTQSSCDACRIDAPKVSKSQMQELIKEIPNWEVRQIDDIPQLFRLYTFKNFKEAWDFTNKIAAMAEEENHHPDILLEWGKVSLSWWSHKIKGLHKNDFICAAKSDELYQ